MLVAMHNKIYFEKAIERFPQISELIAIDGNDSRLNPKAKAIIHDFALYQNILSNMQKLDKIKFDIRLNQTFYSKLRKHLEKKGYGLLNQDTAELYGYDEYNIQGVKLTFYFSYYNPKGFGNFEKIWILPLEQDVLEYFDVEHLRCQCGVSAAKRTSVTG